MKPFLTRRALLGGAGAAALAGCAAPLASTCRETTPTPGIDAVPPAIGPAPMAPFAAAPIEIVRVGFVGVGGMGSVHVQNLLSMDRVELVAIADVDPGHAERARTWATSFGERTPTLYTRGERDFERMIGEESLDIVINATPWQWHVPIALAAMENGKHTATEVPATLRIDDCWALVECAERTQRHCVMLENCIYGRSELMVLRMIREGLLGEIVHAEGGYLHDLRAVKLGDDGEGLWRWRWDTLPSANIYPTHGLGPLANYMDIHRGDRFSSLVSMSGPARGLDAWADAHLPPSDERRQARFIAGDINLSLLQTELGRTILLSHDTNLPRPYSRMHTVQGTRGVFQGYPARIYIEGRSPAHQWEDIEPYREHYEHPLWQRELAIGSSRPGHGGMDYLELERLIHCLHHGLATDMNVYDAAALSAVVELSERSVAQAGAPQRFPDFTRGQWSRWPRLEITPEVNSGDRIP